MLSSSSKKKKRSVEGLSTPADRRAMAVEAVALSTESVQPQYSDPEAAIANQDSHDESALVEAAANEAQLGNEGRRVVQVNSKNKKIQFHKTKKLRKRASALYMKSMADMTAGKFQSWSRRELVDLITRVHNIQLRNEMHLETVAIRDLCESLYTDKPAPAKPPPMSFERIVFENVMARRIQNCWVVFTAMKRMRQEEEQYTQYREQMRAIGSEGGDAEGDVGRAELMYMAMHNEEVVAEGGDVETGLGGTSAGEGKDSDKGSRRKKGKKVVNVLDLPWMPPDLEKARKYADYVQPRKGGKGGPQFDFKRTTTGRHCCLGGLGEQFDLWEEGHVSEFGTFGPGVTNYFKFMKWCFWLFVTLTIISIPVLVLNLSGDYNANKGLKAISQTTIGNLASNEANSTVHIAVPGCNNYGIYPVSCTLNGDSLSLFYAVIDIVVSATIFIAFAWLSVFERLEERTLDESTIRASMYTVAVTKLPGDVTEEEIYTHFSSFVKTKNPIVAVSFAYDNVEEIETCKQRGDIIRSKVHLVHEHRCKCTRIREAGKQNNKTDEDIQKEVDDERAKFHEKMKKLNADLKKAEESLQQLSEVTANAVYAFVTFDKSKDRDIVLDAYNNITLYTYLCNNSHLKLRGGHMLRVKEAPEPSVIIWENLSYTWWDKTKRKMLTTIGALLLIVISLIMVFSSKYLEESAQNNGNEAGDLCPQGWNSLSENEQKDYVEENPSQLYCYCDEMDTFDQAQDPLCRDFLRKNIQSQVLLYFASLVVLLINVSIEKMVNYSSTYEKHHTSDGKGMSIFIRIFLLKYINTAAVFLINNDNVILREVFGLHTKSTTEFTADWFNQVGTTIILVQLGDIFNAHAPHIYKFIKFLRSKRLAKKDPGRYLTQDDLNKAFVGPNFEFAGNYAQLLSTFFVCLTFSTGIPILYPIGAFNFLLFYLVEKYQFIKVYRIPPHFNTLVGKRATLLIPIAILVHLIMSIWVLSNNTMFNTNIDSNASTVGTSVFGRLVADKITAKATFPLFITFCVLIALRIAMYVVNLFWKSIKKFFVACFGCLRSSSQALRDEATNGGASSGASAKKKVRTAAKDVVAYTRAVQRNLIKGLSNYNILLNPTYKEAFGITWKFAAENKNVRDVRNIRARAHGGAEEDDAAQADELARRAAVSRKKAAPKPVARNRSFAGSLYGDLNVPSQDNQQSSGGALSRTASKEANGSGGASGRNSDRGVVPEALERGRAALTVDTTRPTPSPSPSATPTPTPTHDGGAVQAQAVRASIGGSTPHSGGGRGREGTPTSAPARSPRPNSQPAGPPAAAYAPAPQPSPHVRHSYGGPPAQVGYEMVPQQAAYYPPQPPAARSGRSPAQSPTAQQYNYQQLQYIQQQQQAYYQAQVAAGRGAQAGRGGRGGSNPTSPHGYAQYPDPRYYQGPPGPGQGYGGPRY